MLLSVSQEDQLDDGWSPVFVLHVIYVKHCKHCCA